MPTSRSVPTVGVIGAGNISTTYLEVGALFPDLRYGAVADLDSARARSQAEAFGLRALTPAELLADPDIDLVLNLTIPDAHAQVSLAALQAGKSVYSEKPLATHFDDGSELLAAAREQGLALGCAPDTFLGAGLQACRHALDSGAVGSPVAASAIFASHGPEDWHPNPGFFYQPGAGPLFDMGPYYLTALVNLLGPVRRVAALTATGWRERPVERGPRAGDTITVTTPTHVAGTLLHASGVVSSLVISFDVWASESPYIEVYGTRGTLSLPDPNTFGGPARLRRARADGWEELPLTSPYREQARGLGLAEMIAAQRVGAVPRASGELALHVLEIMEGLLRSSEEERMIAIITQPDRPAALAPGALDASFLGAA
jgi:predicted dehydrogenase